MVPSEQFRPKFEVKLDDDIELVIVYLMRDGGDQMDKESKSSSQ